MRFLPVRSDEEAEAPGVGATRGKELFRVAVPLGCSVALVFSGLIIFFTSVIGLAPGLDAASLRQPTIPPQASPIVQPPLPPSTPFPASPEPTPPSTPPLVPPRKPPTPPPPPTLPSAPPSPHPPPSPSPAPPPPPYKSMAAAGTFGSGTSEEDVSGFQRLAHLNCWPGHGAEDLEVQCGRE